MTSSMDLFAASQGVSNQGPLECHWCASKCARTWTHDDPGPATFKKTPYVAKRPGNAFVCVGCYLWRRKRVTVPFFGSTEYKDGRCFMDYSVVITDRGAWAVRVPDDADALYKLLLSPPLTFCLSLIEKDRAKTNLLQLAPVNEVKEVRGDTELSFLLNGTPFKYSVYELEETLRNGPAGRSPGARALEQLLGPYTVVREGDDAKDDKKQKGRPKKEEPGVPQANRKVS